MLPFARTAWSFISSTSIVASLNYRKTRVMRRLRAILKYSKTSNRVYIILLFREGASRAFEASTPRCIWVANQRILFSYERIEKYLSSRGSTKSVSSYSRVLSACFAILYRLLPLRSHPFILTRDNGTQYMNRKCCRDILNSKQKYGKLINYVEKDSILYKANFI